MPVTSYAPEMLAALERASKGEVVILLGPKGDPDAKAKAVRLRFRLHNLRKEMRREHHPMTNLVNQVELLIGTRGEQVCLIIRPADNDFVPALRQAGATIEGLAPADNPILDHVPGAPTVISPVDAMQQFFSGKKNTTEGKAE